MGQSGNADEWQETANDLGNNTPGENRGIRGGYWNYFGTSNLSSSSRSFANPTLENVSTGFRVASLSAVPEPGSLAFWGLLGLVGWLRMRK